MRILIITQHIFPIQTPRANRSTELIKELSRKGHSVTVYAVLGKYDYTNFEKEFNVKINKINIKWQFHPYSSDGDNYRNFFDKVFGRLFGKIFEFPNIEFLYRVPEILNNKTKFDLLISIADPHQIHWGCSKAKSKYPEFFPKKWIADCGDPFMKNGIKSAHLNYYSKYEKEFCRLANHVTVPVNEAIDAYYKEYHHKFSIIPQGFEFDLNKINQINCPGKVINFAFAGIFYKDIRNPKSFINYLLQMDIDFVFHIYTKYDEIIKPYKEKFKNKIKVYQPIDRCDLLKVFEKMDFLVNIENNNCPRQIPSKLIDYAISQRPILSINPKNLDKIAIREFLNRNYTRKFVVNNIEQYHISNVTEKFLELYYTK